MKIFVAGAAGYIGHAVAAACSQAGHDVFGLVRSKEKAPKLEASEVEPIIGHLEEPSSYAPIATEHAQDFIFQNPGDQSAFP